MGRIDFGTTRSHRLFIGIELAIVKKAVEEGGGKAAADPGPSSCELRQRITASGFTDIRTSNQHDQERRSAIKDRWSA